MNKRLEELAKQASYTVKGGNGCVWGDNVNLEKFAELIVTECADVAIEQFKYGDIETPASSAMLKHFGLGFGPSKEK